MYSFGGITDLKLSDQPDTCATRGTDTTKIHNEIFYVCLREKCGWTMYIAFYNERSYSEHEELQPFCSLC